MPVFSQGRVSGQRFRVQDGRAIFGPEHLEKLADAAIGRQRVAMGDGSQMGWIAGGHVLDTDFTFETCAVNGTLQFALRIDDVRPPAALKRAYYEQEVAAFAKENPSGFASKKQKREARFLAKDRIEQEAKEGKWLRRRAFPALWDGDSGELLFGSTSADVTDRLHSLFRQTFGKSLEWMGATRRARAIAEGFAGLDMPVIVNPAFADEVAWALDENNCDFLGNEFLLWLWHFTEHVSDTVKLRDDSECVVMLTRTLTLDCPRGQTGKETISSDMPGRLVEAIKAAQSGKLPRKAGLTLVRHHQVYEVTLQAESLAFSAKLPKPESGEDRAVIDERVDSIRACLETLDLLYEAFLSRRLSDAWGRELGTIRGWLNK